MLAYPVSDDALLYLTEKSLSGLRLVVLSPQEALYTYIRISLMLGVALTLPVFIHQAYRFINPALKQGERRMLLPLIISSATLFLIGAAFGLYILAPQAISFLTSVSVKTATPMYSLSPTVSFILNICLAMGLAFQLPLASALLARLGLVSSRALRHYRRHAIVGVFIASAVITDPSIFTQILLAVPLIALFEIGVLAAWMVEK